MKSVKNTSSDLMKIKALSLLGLISFLAISCGSPEESSALPQGRQLLSPTAQNPDPNDDGGDNGGSGNTTSFAQNAAVPKNTPFTLSFPTTHEGFCKVTNGVANAEWRISPTGVAGFSIDNDRVCKPKITLGNNFNANTVVDVIGKVPTTGNNFAEITYHIRLRRAPILSSPAAPVALNTNMRLSKNTFSNPPLLYFRDGDQVTNREFQVPVTFSDPTPELGTTDDFSFSFSCDSTAITPGCGGACPILNATLIENRTKVKINFAGSVQNNIFYISNSQCVANSSDDATPVHIRMTTTSPGGSVQKEIATLFVEIN